MRKSLRLTTTKESFANIKDFKKQVVTRTAQRKFAGNVQQSNVHRDSGIPQQTTTPKTEDFINFLCLRDAPFLSSELEIFAEPIQVTNLQHEEIFKTELDGEQDIEEIRANDGDKDSEPKAKKKCTREAVIETIEMHNVASVQPSYKEFKDFFQFSDSVFKSHQHLIHIQPSADWKCLSYVQEGLKFSVRTLHVHRLKLPACDNFVTLQCLQKQLERDSVSMPDIPCLGLCEVDLPHLMEVVNSFGGVDSVNSDQNWRALSEQLRIPKSASRRVTQLEKIYLKYILPFDLLPDADKSKLRSSVKNERKRMLQISKDFVSNKTISLETFHRMACNSLYYYWKKDATSEETEQQLWKIVNEGKRHVAAYSGEIDLYNTPQSYQNPKLKVPWKLSTLFSHEKSALRFLGKVSNITVPRILVESVFALGAWQVDEHGLNTLSYLHAGCDKIWYVIPPQSSKRFSKFNKIANGDNTFLTPDELLGNGCQVIRCVQKEGQYVVVESGCYYCTLPTGYSLSEIVNFASAEWLGMMLNNELKLNDFVEIKILLNYMNDVIKTDNDSPYKEILIEKLDSLSILLSHSLARLAEFGINNVEYLKSKPQDTDTCKTCDTQCYFLFVTFDDSDDDEEVYCLDHAITMVKAKKSWASKATIIALLQSNKISQLISKLKTKPKK